MAVCNYKFNDRDTALMIVDTDVIALKSFSLLSRTDLTIKSASASRITHADPR